MKIQHFRKSGLVDWELNRSLQPFGEIIALSREEADFSDHESLRDVVRNIKPDVIVNTAAYTAVDKAEEEEELATLINGAAPGVLAEEAKKQNALLVHYSTDYVFDGNKKEPYVESDKPNPINAYGRSKLAGEDSIQNTTCDYLILRTSWVYSTRGDNFLKKILQLAKERGKLNIVDDQAGAPTWARSIADITSKILLVDTNKKNGAEYRSGIYHLASSSCTTWYEFANKIVSTGLSTGCNSEIVVKEIAPISSEEFTTAAKRPRNSCLSTEKIKKEYGVTMPSWQDSLQLCMDSICR